MVYVEVTNGYISDAANLKTPDYIAVDGRPPQDILNGCYKLIDGSFVFDHEKFQVTFEAPEQTLDGLQAELAASDYKVIKAGEYEMCGLPAPYDMEQLHGEREALRKMIRELSSDEAT
jgi:hypothetical protein